MSGPDWDHVDPPAPDDAYLDEPWSRFEDFGTPIAADGIKARSRRGPIGDSWWSRRFLGFLEDVGHGGRLGRGRTYARKGQVLDLTFEAGEIRARVQGSRPEPYDVCLAAGVVEERAWTALEKALAGRAAHAATLLDGRLPHDFEEVAGRCGVEILPSGGSGLLLGCTCPDFETVCKHVAAVCYVAAEAFDDDPFLLLQWRGRTRGELLAGLRRSRSGPGHDRTRRSPRSRVPSSRAGTPEGRSFWHAGPGLDSVRVRPAAAFRADAALAERGPLGLRIGPLDVEDFLGPMYLRITQAAEARAYRDAWGR